jgi:hypothetical protein
MNETTEIAGCLMAVILVAECDKPDIKCSTTDSSSQQPASILPCGAAAMQSSCLTEANC